MRELLAEFSELAREEVDVAAFPSSGGETLVASTVAEGIVRRLTRNRPEGRSDVESARGFSGRCTIPLA